MDAQKDKLKKYADYQEMSIVGEYSDEGKSGKSVEGRPEFQQMLRDIEEGKDNIYKAVKVRTVDGADGGIDKLEITVNAENYKVILQELRKALIQNCKGYDVEELLWFVNQHLAMTGQGTYAAEQVEVIFNRDMMVNESQVIADINNSAGILSKRTLVSMHPWVSDVQAELDELEKEQEEQMEQFGNTFERVEGDEDVEE